MISRRELLTAASPLALAGCRNESRYFGNTQPPGRQHLICATIDTGGSLDPARSADFVGEGSILRALFEGLTTYHPQTLEPMAGIATHHEISPDGLRITLYLRGHSRPRGAALPNTNNLRSELRSGTLTVDLSGLPDPPPDRVPVYWSDGAAVTAHDVVYSWRRAIDRDTAAPYGYLLYSIQNAREVNAGGMSPDKLGVRALDDFTLQVDLRAPTSFFLELLSCPPFFPVPRQAIESAKSDGREERWTEPGAIVTSGAFTLRERRARDRIVLARNPHYIEAGLIGLDQVSFLFIPEFAVGANLYRSGRAHFTSGLALPPMVVPALRGKRDLRRARAFGTFFPCFNTKKPPFDNVLVRYAFNMATDKRAITDVFGFGRTPARTLVPPMARYRAPDSLRVQIDDKTYDVLDYDPAGAQALLAKAGYPGGLDSQGRRLRIHLLCGSFADARLHCEILQQQWQATLGVEVPIETQEFGALIQNIFSGNYEGITIWNDWGFYLDPNWFLDQFVTGSSVNPSGWSDPKYDYLLAEANATTDAAVRMQRLAECELYLLRAMPFFPEYFDVWAYPQKPYLRGIQPNAMDVHPFKYAWIDTNWRPS